MVTVASGGTAQNRHGRICDPHPIGLLQCSVRYRNEAKLDTDDSLQVMLVARGWYAYARARLEECGHVPLRDA
jgi:hypothetical protein